MMDHPPPQTGLKLQGYNFAQIKWLGTYNIRQSLRQWIFGVVSVCLLKKNSLTLELIK